MKRLSAALTREEVARFLQLSPEVVDALIESGHLLCHLRDGEARVPLDQIEDFFREGLVRFYRTEAHLLSATEAFEVAPPPEPARPRREEPPPAEPLPEPAPEIEPEPVIISHQAEPIPEIEKPEFRQNPRYVPRRQIDGIFKDVRFSIVQLSTTGLRIRHKDSLVPGEEAKVSFALLNPAQSFVMRARVVWTSVAKYDRDDEETFCISGLRVTEHVERLVKAIERLQSSHDLQTERRTDPRNDEPVSTSGPEGVSDDEVAIIMNALHKFAGDPLEANRWYSRARFAVADEQVRKAAPHKLRDREEVLGIWEYLDRRMEIPKVSSVVSWIRRARGNRAAK